MMSKENHDGVQVDGSLYLQEKMNQPRFQVGSCRVNCLRAFHKNFLCIVKRMTLVKFTRGHEKFKFEIFRYISKL